MLTRAQIDFYRSNGYLVVENVLDQEAVLDPVRREYAALMDDLYENWLAQGRVPPGTIGFQDRLLASYRAGCDWFQPMDISLPGDRIEPDTPMHFGPAVFRMITDTLLLDLVQDLIGPEITSNPIQHVRIKPPVPQLAKGEIRAHVGGTDWHQDRAVALEEADQTDMVTVWIAVTDATRENGCLQVMPGRPDAMLPHCPKQQTAIADGFIDETRAVPLPVRSGGVVVLDPMLPHASLPNLSTGLRWSFDLRFNRTGQPTGRSHFPAFVARSTLHPDRVLTDWKAWRDLWVAARAGLAERPHVPIHRWRADSPSCA
jgi:ectoine hydroxylase-related dioxygenase (phytanoyl-CoA dioxygenase family)